MTSGRAERYPVGVARERIPPPLLKRRLPSGRGAMLQPNATGDSDAPLTVRFWAVLTVTGAVTGLLAIALMWLLFTVEHAAFGVNGNAGGFSDAVADAHGWHRVAPLLVAGVVGGVGWYLLRRYTRGKTEADEILWTGEGRLSVPRSAGSSILSEIVIGLGASLGREAAPKLMGAVAGTVFGRWGAMSTGQQRLLVACGAGAGLATVYNVPLGGALFTAEVLLGTVSLPTVLPALACSAVATWVGWLYLPSHASYLGIPDYAFDVRLLVWALVAGPIIGVLAAGFIRAVGLVSFHRARGRWVLVAPLVAFGLLAMLALRYPLLYGNGKGIADTAFLGVGGLGLFVALALLKPLVTALCLGSGASGGLFTPVLSIGAVLGAGLGIVWSHVWPGSPVGAFAMIGAAAMIGAGMQAPLAALVLVVELTHCGYGLMVPMVIATVIATAMSRWIDGYSIYTARVDGIPTTERPDGRGTVEAL